MGTKNTSELAHEELFKAQLESIPDLDFKAQLESISDLDLAEELIRRFKLRWAKINHLENIISHIEQKAKEGLTVISAGTGSQNK